ncbi:SWI/SNF-related matrix-associated actin-dependent regulator of chromatin subfamily A member 5 [Yarrowia sp. C11]|nr:SWI/SNF-related matrix-associated actin-dependent regulator of chromatin subfamily A member 5 [Yarrowia sp. E02]KAG5372259.1 SWI/SNF-related matrix-associated actin-dependent regulator of chromatin subfamily A member 5 [Yarrowia sp. C11]
MSVPAPIDLDKSNPGSSMVSTVTTPNRDTPPVQLSNEDLLNIRSGYLLPDKGLGKPKQKSIPELVKKIKHLYGLSDVFEYFLKSKGESDPNYKKAMEQAREELGLNKTAEKPTGGARHRKTEKEEDAELMQGEEEAENSVETVFESSPGYVHGTLREYQVQGLNWMVSLYEHGLSGILADEMGLGKTLQTISFLGYLRYFRGIPGPHLVCVPKSTLDNWAREFAKWTPEVNVLVLQGDKESRAQLIQDRLLTCDFDVCITSYEMVLREKGYLRRFAWQYIVIDEAHRIKNEESSLSQIIRLFHTENRLLITGTPLQNNLHELWALLNYILPDVFQDSAAFDAWFGEDQSGDQDAAVNQLHKILRPFLLRRVKADVEKSLLPKKEINLYVGMSDMQVRWYQKILEKDIDAVNGQVGKREGKTRLLNIVMQLRKCCNHPYLFEGAEPGPPYTTDEHLVYNAGKMVILDKLLKRIQEQGSRVLIFSQMSRVLDILEDYCLFRGYKYCRIDGQTAHEDRINAIDAYNKEGSEKFVFLLTTRAGGLGINLTTADQVVLYDSDWNPQADLQAMDRAHRIGQTKQVYVYRFITENAVEEKVIERATQKLRLDKLVIQQGRSQSKVNNNAQNKDDLLNMIQFGAEKVFNRGKGEEQEELDLDIEDILKRGQQKTMELNSRYDSLGLDDLQKFTSDSAYEWNGEDFKKKDTSKTNKAFTWIAPNKRERKENYSIDSYYREMLNQGTAAGKNAAPKAPKAPKQLNIQDHQFYPQRLIDIQEKETSYYRKQIGYKVPLPDGAEEELEMRESERDLEQQEIDNAEPLTEEEEEEKVELSSKGFSNWNRRDFTNFVQASARHGRNNFADIATEFEDKTQADIKKYAGVFWQRYTEINGFDRYIQQIESGEDKAKKQNHQNTLLTRKVEGYEAPLQQMVIAYPAGQKKIYSEDEDRYILVQLYRYGLETEGVYEMIRDAIRASPVFRFDWFFLSRTPAELARRGQTLLSYVGKEYDGAGEKRKSSSTPDVETPKKAAKKKKT